MSLKTALKAGLGPLEINGDLSYKGASGIKESDTKVSNTTIDTGEGSLRGVTNPEMQVASGLSDSLPKPKLNARMAPEAANVNKQTKVKARPASHQENIDFTPKKVNLTTKDEQARVNPRQYVRELDRFLTKQNSHLTQGVVLDVSSAEVERIAKLSARVRGRYIAKLLDVGSAGRGALKESELSELKRSRQSYEELSAGIDLLKNAISNGDITVTGWVEN